MSPERNTPRASSEAARRRMLATRRTGSSAEMDLRRRLHSRGLRYSVDVAPIQGSKSRADIVFPSIRLAVFVDGCFYLVTTDDEDTLDYWLTRVDAKTSTPQIEDLIRIPFAARALAWDGTHFWTNHRERNQIVSFARPD